MKEPYGGRAPRVAGSDTSSFAAESMQEHCSTLSWQWDLIKKSSGYLWAC
jgi:hypothetical protein